MALHKQQLVAQSNEHIQGSRIACANIELHTSISKLTQLANLQKIDFRKIATPAQNLKLNR